MEKIGQVVVEKDQKAKDAAGEEDLSYEYSQDENESGNRQGGQDDVGKRLSTDIIAEVKDKIAEKGQSKDWTDREMALKHMKETIENSGRK